MSPRDINEIRQPREMRMESLARANEIRALRAGAKQTWKELGATDARVALIGLLEQTPDWAQTWRVEKVLRSIPQIGSVRVKEVMNSIVISPGKTICGLTERQRTELIAWLDGKAE